MIDLMRLLTKPSQTNEAPSANEQWRNDLILLAFVLFALVLSIGIRNRGLNAANSVALGPNFPRIAYPLSWRPTQAEGYALQAINPASPSVFDATLQVSARPLSADETLDLARATLVLERSAALDRYRELAVEAVTVFDGTPAVLSTYAYIADPTRDSGAMGAPVVVQGQDLVFLYEAKERGAVVARQVMVVSLVADAAEFDAEQRDFDIVFHSLKMVRGEEQ